MLTVTCIAQIDKPEHTRPRGDLHLYESSTANDFAVLLIDVSSIINCSEEETSAAAVILLFSLLCSELLVAYSVPNIPHPHSLLEQFVIFHHLLYYSFAGEAQGMCSTLGSTTELLVLSSEKGIKNTEQAILSSLLTFEEGYDEEIAARNQLRELLTEIFPKKSGLPVAVHETTETFLSELLSTADVHSKFKEQSFLFSEGFYSSGILLADYIEKYHLHMKSNSSEGYLTPKLLSTWKVECVVVRIKYLCEDLVESYNQAMEAASSKINNFDDFESFHRKERAVVISIFNSTVKTYVSQAVSFKKQLQAKIRLRKNEFVKGLQGHLDVRAQEIYEKNYHILDNVKKQSISQQITLVDAGSPYSNLVAFKSMLSTYLSTCKLEITAIGTVSNQDILSEVLHGEMKEIIEKSHYWVDAFSTLFNQAHNSREESRLLLQRLAEEDMQFDVQMKALEAVHEKELSKLEETLTSQRILQSTQIEEKSTRLEVIGEKVERATRLNEKEKNELQDDLMALQTDIAEVQHRSLDKRQERETQTDHLHRGIVEQERENHEWFKTSIQKQRAMLERELALERELNSKRSFQMSSKFKTEAEHLHELEAIRTAGLNDLQAFKENRLRKKEKDYKEHEGLLSRYNFQINELDAKLALTAAVSELEIRKQSDRSGPPIDSQKKCIIA